MNNVFDILEENGLSIELLNRLSYQTRLGKSLKRNIHYFEKDDLMKELSDMTDWLDEQECFSDIVLDYRIKSMDSILLKYDRYYPNRQVRQVFNDILGFRAYCSDYVDVIALESDVFRVVDMTNGKSEDDGYRGVHLYYQIDNNHYPIEIQFNTYYDRQFNDWLHKYLYKKDYTNSIGATLRSKYEKGNIIDEAQFKEALENVLHCG